VVEAGVGRFRSFWLMTLEEIPILARLEPVMVTSVGCHDLVGGIIEEFVCPSSIVSTPEGNLRSLG
jgi:hypothetical protein